MSLAEKFDQFLDASKFYNFEGLRGVNNFETVVEFICGYQTIHEFLEDNPGAIDAMVDWIRNRKCPEWEDKLTRMGYTDYDEEDQDQE